VVLYITYMTPAVPRVL